MSPYQYVVLRCVPRVDREEFVNIGVVLYCPDESFLDVLWDLRAAKLHALDPGLDLDLISDAMHGIDLLCRGEAHGDAATAVRATAYGTREAAETQGTRFGMLKAPKSTVVQPGPVHGGMTADANETLQGLLERLVR
ncbi:MAG: DUF3037 domain-containing protein [Nocardioidaceae bacterium]|nr:DUF3037 domain-containing protein [Nocardioidaceae bacterium]MCL2611614.1 DUF3037 domain-containing protein [Nocardioidaceae bacterium]